MNCNQQLKKLRKQQAEEKKINAVYQAYNILSLLTLYEDLGFREKRMEQYTQGLSERMALFQSGKLDLNTLVDKLTEYGIYIQDVNWDGL